MGITKGYPVWTGIAAILGPWCALADTAPAPAPAAQLEEITVTGAGVVDVVVRGGGQKRRLRVKGPVVLSVVAGPPGGMVPPDRTGNPADVDLLSLLADPEATVVRRRTELLGREEPASRGTEEVTSARALIEALSRR